MKKFLAILFSLLFLFSCSGEKAIVGDYVVYSVHAYTDEDYHTKYMVKMRSLNELAVKSTLNHFNWFNLYTNELYQVGDTLTIVKR